MLRVNSIIHEILAEEIEKLADTRLELVTVTGVDTTPDLRHSIVYVDVLQADQQEAAIHALNKASPRLRGAVGRQVRMKYTPDLRFALDPGVLSGTRIEELLRQLGEEE